MSRVNNGHVLFFATFQLSTNSCVFEWVKLTEPIARPFLGHKALENEEKSVVVNPSLRFTNTIFTTILDLKGLGF